MSGNNITQKKKIMHITHGLGGIQTYLEYVLNYCDKKKFDFIIVAPYNTAFQQFCKPVSKYYPLKVKREVSFFSDIFLLFKLIRLIKKEKPDILHVHSAKGGFLGRLAGRFCNAKVIYTPHGFSYLSFLGLKRIFFFMLECMAKNWSNVLLAVSYSEANRAIFEIGYQPVKVKVIPNAIQVSKAPFTRSYDAVINIGMIGRLTQQKNPLLFLHIAECLLHKYHKLQFSILGAGLDDHLGAELNQFIKANNFEDKIHLLSWGSSETSKTFIEQTDIFVMTSVFEGLPYSLLEAMESACPCVVSKADGNIDVIQNNENGFVCFTKEEFCDRIETLINSQELRERIGQSARQYVNDKHNIVIATGHLQNIYMEI